MNQASATYPAAVVLLFLAIVLLPTAAADPLGFSEGGGLQAAKWDFSTLADYVTNNVTLAAGNATLATTATWWNYTTDATFLASQDSSTNVVVSSGLRLINNATGLIQDGTFNLAPGPWTYASGTTNQVIAQRDPVGRARLSHSTPRFQFDSMDAVFGTRPWRSVANGQSASTLAQSTAIREEGTGSLRDYVTINSQGSGSYAGAYRNDWGTWNWSAYNRLAIWIEGTNASGLSAFILMTNLAGVNWASWMPQHLAPGWHRYVYDISAFSGTNDQIDQVQVGFTGGVGTYTAYVDDLVLFQYTAFDETANVSQAFTKPNATSGNPGSLALRFDVGATAAVNLVPYLRMNVGGFAWSESPVPVGTRTVSLDLSGDPALRASGSFNLTFSLELIRIGTEDASMSVWLDNVTLTAERYQNGSFTALPIDAGFAANWTMAEVRAATNPPATTVVVETRTGNRSSTGDPSWSAWRPVVGSRVDNPSNRFLQWRLSLNTDGVGTPLVTNLSIRSETFALRGTVRTASFVPSQPVFAWQAFFATDLRAGGTSILYEVSVDGGANWAQAKDGQDLSGLSTGPMIIRATLSTGNTSLSPTIRSLTLSYRPSIWSAVLSPWTALMALGLAVAGYVAWKRIPRRTSPDDLFLVGLDGRLLLHTTARPMGEMDDDILAGMLTAITMFVRDAFKEEHEELKRFEFGNRNVIVERGQHVYLAAIYPGHLPIDASRSLNDFIADLGERYSEMLAYWYYVDDLPGLREMMIQFAGRGRYRRGDWRRPWRMPRRRTDLRSWGGIPDSPPVERPARPGGELERAEAPLVSLKGP